MKKNVYDMEDFLYNVWCRLESLKEDIVDDEMTSLEIRQRIYEIQLMYSNEIGGDYDILLQKPTN